jgi:hypothetical protein
MHRSKIGLPMSLRVKTYRVGSITALPLYPQ